MAVLIRAAVIAVLLAGCYAPDVRDCTVSCAAADDCVDGQVCAGGWCTAGDACGDVPTADAAALDATEPDGGSGATAELRVLVEHRGKIVVSPLGEACETTDDHDPGDCTFTVPAGSVQTLLPVETEHEFERWTTMNCMMAGMNACTLTIAAPTVVSAKFH